MLKYKVSIIILVLSYSWLNCLADIELGECYERKLVGVIGKDLKIHVDLVIANQKITGIYFYDKYKKEIAISGTIDNQNKFVIHESDGTGIFKGEFVSSDRAEGVWVNPEGSKEYTFWMNTQYVSNPIYDYVYPGIVKEYKESAELIQIKADFNNDGLLDYCISETSEWSNSNGGLWQIYCQRKDGMYYKIGSLYFNPHVIAIEPFKAGIGRVVLYWHISVAEGIIGESFVTEDGIKSGRSTRLIAEHPGSEEIKSEDPFGCELFKIMGNQMFKPEVKKCWLSDYLIDKNCEWYSYSE